MTSTFGEFMHHKIFHFSILMAVEAFFGRKPCCTMNVTDVDESKVNEDQCLDPNIQCTDSGIINLTNNHPTTEQWQELIISAFLRWNVLSKSSSINYIPSDHIINYYVFILNTNKPNAKIYQFRE